MNKKKVSFLIFMFLNIVIFHSQNIEGKITYAVSAKTALSYIEKKQSKKDNKNKKEIKSSIKALYKNAIDTEAILKFNKSSSEYFNLEKMNLSNKEVFNYTYIMAGGTSKYYTSNSTKGYVSETLDCELFGDCFLIENLQPKWELKNETKNIGGFLCYKAILKNKRNGKFFLEAWFTPKIPYQYGIMNYYGLPGVILEINRNTIRITAIKIELNPNEKITIDKPKNIKKLTSEEFDKLKRKSFSELYKKN